MKNQSLSLAIGFAAAVLWLVAPSALAAADGKAIGRWHSMGTLQRPDAPSIPTRWTARRQRSSQAGIRTYRPFPKRVLLRQSRRRGWGVACPPVSAVNLESVSC